MYEHKRQAFGRVSFRWPGKHGWGDIRVEFGDKAPSHAEFLAMAWGLARAEDRYSETHHEGRWMLKRLIDEVFAAQRWNEAQPVIERAAQSVKDRRAA